MAARSPLSRRPLDTSSRESCLELTSAPSRRFATGRRCRRCQAAETHIRHAAPPRACRRCARCLLVFVPPAVHLDPVAEKAHYDTHDTRPDDPGYRRFLARLADPLADRLAPGSSGLDF